MNVIIVSDLHLGSRHCKRDLFLRFLDTLPPEVTLVFNGDTVDFRYRRLGHRFQVVLDRLAEESRRRPVIWVYGNHDEDYRPWKPGDIRFVNSWAIERRLLVQHGYAFDRVMPFHRLFILVVRMFHGLRIRFGAESVHVAEYAKRWSALYAVLRRSVMKHAIAHAKRNGFAAVTCGHTHYAEDMMVEGIRYINSGTWTETPAHYIAVDDTTIELKTYPPRML